MKTQTTAKRCELLLQQRFFTATKGNGQLYMRRHPMDVLEVTAQGEESDAGFQQFMHELRLRNGKPGLFSLNGLLEKLQGSTKAA